MQRGIPAKNKSAKGNDVNCIAAKGETGKATATKRLATKGDYVTQGMKVFCDKV